MKPTAAACSPAPSAGLWCGANKGRVLVAGEKQDVKPGTQVYAPPGAEYGPVTAQIPPDEAVRDAAASCPVEAISLGDADAGQPVALD